MLQHRTLTREAVTIIFRFLNTYLLSFANSLYLHSSELFNCVSMSLAHSVSSVQRMDPAAPVEHAENPKHIPLCRFLGAVMKFKSGFPRQRRPRPLDLRDTIVAMLISLSYLTFIFCRSFIGPLAPALTDDPNLDYSNSKHGTLLIFVGVAYGIGKLTNGPLIDSMNPRLCMLVYILGSAGCVFLFSLITSLVDLPQRYNFIVATCVVNAWFQSGGWPAMAKYIYYRYHKEQYGQVFSFLSLSSRLGAISTLFLLGYVLTIGQWQRAARVAVVITACGVLPLACTALPSLQPRQPPLAATAPPVSKDTESKQQSKLSLYCGWWLQADFLLITLSTGCLGVLVALDMSCACRLSRCAGYECVVGCLGVLAALDSFAPLWITDTFDATTGEASMISAVLPAGVMVSVAGIGFILSTRRNKVVGNASILMVLCLFCICMFLAFLSGGTEQGFLPRGGAGLYATIGIFLFLMGLMVGFPYYIPPSTFVLEFGQNNAAMVSSMMDVVSAIIGAAFAQVAGVISETSWGKVWLLIAFIAFLAFLLLVVKHWKSLLKKKHKLSSESLTHELQPGEPEERQAILNKQTSSLPGEDGLPLKAPDQNAQSSFEQLPPGNQTAQSSFEQLPPGNQTARSSAEGIPEQLPPSSEVEMMRSAVEGGGADWPSRSDSLVLARDSELTELSHPDLPAPVS
eukprot:g81542.t1